MMSIASYGICGSCVGSRRALLPVWSAEFAIMRWSATTSSRTSTFPKSRQFVVCPAAWR